MDVSPASEDSIKKPINDGTRKGRNIYMIDHSLMGKIDVINTLFDSSLASKSSISPFRDEASNFPYP